MAETYLEELKRYVRFGESDEQRLRELHPHAKPHFAWIVDAFYDRLLGHEAAAKVLRNHEQVERLKVTLLDWLDRLLAGPWDEDYYERRSKIGRIHVQVDLPQRYMFTAMEVIELGLLELAEQALAGDSTALYETTHALSKVIKIDLAIMLESYRDDSFSRMQRLERLERELIAHRLELSEERYDAVVEGAEALIIATDTEDRIVLFNSKAEEVTGRLRSEMIGRPAIETLIHTEDAALARAAAQQALTGSPPAAFEARLLDRRERVRNIRWHLTLLPTPGAAQVCAIGVDITEERLLAERTRRVERLANLGTLAAGLAHEIRNPLNAAQLQLTLLERRLSRAGGDADVGDAPKIVREELQRLAGLVQDFLAFARPSNLRVKGGDLRTPLAAAIELMKPVAAEESVTLDSNELTEPIALQYDEEKIKQVLLNLMRNAIEAADGGGDVYVHAKREGEFAILEIRDSGPGIPEDVDIFEPFATTKESGTGLGLPIVHRIISEHGGDITVRRDNDQTIFRVELPLDGPPR